MNKKLKSKVTSFMALGTRPEEYTVGFTVHHSVSHCELCGSALEYSFPLVHKSSTDEDKTKNLLVGSDCIDNFMEAYFPQRREEIKRRLKQLVDKTKSQIFLEENPEIKAQAREFMNYVQSTLRAEAKAENLYNEWVSLYRSEFFKEFAKNCREIIRKEYLTKPKTQKFKEVYALIKTDMFMNLLRENKLVHERKIKEVMEEESEFYSIYMNRNFYSEINKEQFLNRPALTNIEKQNYLVITREKKKKLALVVEVLKGVA